MYREGGVQVFSIRKCRACPSLQIHVIDLVDACLDVVAYVIHFYTYMSIRESSVLG